MTANRHLCPYGQDRLDLRHKGHDYWFLKFHRTQHEDSFDLHRNDNEGLLAVPAEQLHLFCHPRAEVLAMLLLGPCTCS